jgi:thymidylate synthase (FAD)
MRVIKQSFEILATPSPEAIRGLIEICGRTAYKSESECTDETARAFALGIVRRGHLSVIEHAGMSVRFVTDRGVSHEIVRHRLASFTQESTRYCNYGKEKFGKELTFIEPVWGACPIWIEAMMAAETAYLGLIEEGQSAQQARAVLPNSLKTEIVVTANLREWRHIFQLRAVEKAAHPQMRDLMIPLYLKCRENIPELFDLGEPQV